MRLQFHFVRFRVRCLDNRGGGFFNGCSRVGHGGSGVFAHIGRGGGVFFNVFRCSWDFCFNGFGGFADALTDFCAFLSDGAQQIGALRFDVGSGFCHRGTDVCRPIFHFVGAVFERGTPFVAAFWREQ